jgi:hypothetical protein
MLGAGDHKEVGSVTEYLIGDVGVAHPRVSRFGDAGHAMSMSSTGDFTPDYCI